MPDPAQTDQRRTVSERTRNALEAAGIHAGMPDDPGAPLYVSDLCVIAAREGCSAADLLPS